jgi:hypothetical protein
MTPAFPFFARIGLAGLVPLVLAGCAVAVPDATPPAPPAAAR